MDFFRERGAFQNELKWLADSNMGCKRLLSYIRVVGS